MQQCQICSGVRDAAGHSRAWHARQRGQLLYFVWSLVNSCLFSAAPYQHLVLHAQMLYFHAQDADGLQSCVSLVLLVHLVFCKAL